MRKPLVIALIALLVLAVAGGVVYSLLPKGKPALAEPPRAEGTKGEGQVGEPLPKEGEQADAAPAGCVEGELAKFKFNSPELPRAKLGEWVAAKTKDGKEAVRFRVSLVDVAPMGTFTVAGEPTPLIIARFRIHVENLTCGPFAWDMKRPGFWIGITKRDPNSEIVGWFPSDKLSPVIHQIAVAENGHLEGFDANDTQTTEDIIRQEFGELPTPLPKRIGPGENAEGYFDVIIGNIYLRKGDPYLPVGPEGDGNLPMAIGGYMSYVRVDLGSVKSWWEQKADDKDKESLGEFMNVMRNKKK